MIASTSANVAKESQYGTIGLSSKRRFPDVMSYQPPRPGPKPSKIDEAATLAKSK
jgi:hypothetical protein